jgi:hypothetical protein
MVRGRWVANVEASRMFLIVGQCSPSTNRLHFVARGYACSLSLSLAVTHEDPKLMHTRCTSHRSITILFRMVGSLAGQYIAVCTIEHWSHTVACVYAWSSSLSLAAAHGDRGPMHTRCAPHPSLIIGSRWWKSCWTADCCKRCAAWEPRRNFEFIGAGCSPRYRFLLAVAKTQS